MTPYIREMDDGIQFDMVFNSDLSNRARMIELRRSASSSGRPPRMAK